MIPANRQKETYLDGAYWCSTVMSLLDFDGSPKYVWNPFSMAQLKSKLVNFDAYLDCVASKNDGSCAAPTDPIFEEQQVPLLSVYQRCLTNYQSKLWDQGAFVMFNATLQQQLRLDQVMPSVIEDRFRVSKCLLDQKATGGDNTGCLTDYFLKGTQSVDYFAYSNITTTDRPGSGMIDACLTFSGPAASENPRVAEVFLNCLESNANNSGCEIPHMLWSGRSSNKLPVAAQHAMNISDPDKRRSLAEGEIAAAQATVLAALENMKSWQGAELKITLFSSEGTSFVELYPRRLSDRPSHSGHSSSILGLRNAGTRSHTHTPMQSTATLAALKPHSHIESAFDATASTTSAAITQSLAAARLIVSMRRDRWARSPSPRGRTAWRRWCGHVTPRVAPIERLSFRARGSCSPTATGTGTTRPRSPAAPTPGGR